METVRTTCPVTGRPISMRVQSVQEAEAERQPKPAFEGFEAHHFRAIRLVRIPRHSGVREGNKPPGRASMHRALMSYEEQKNKGAA